MHSNFGILNVPKPLYLDFPFFPITVNENQRKLQKQNVLLSFTNGNVSVTCKICKKKSIKRKKKLCVPYKRKEREIKCIRFFQGGQLKLRRSVAAHQTFGRHFLFQLLQQFLFLSDTICYCYS